MGGLCINLRGLTRFAGSAFFMLNRLGLEKVSSAGQSVSKTFMVIDAFNSPAIDKYHHLYCEVMALGMTR